MKNTLMKIFVFLIMCLCILKFNGYSQNKYFIGCSVIEDRAAAHLQTSGGISIEYLLNSKNGIETGINYRTCLNDKVFIPYATGSNGVAFAHYLISEKYLSVPFIYNHRSSLFNLSFGATIDIFVGWKEHQINTQKIPSYNFDSKPLIGILGKLGKTFRLSNKFSIEPDLHFNPIITTYTSFSNKYPHNIQYFGVGITTKYFFKA